MALKTYLPSGAVAPVALVIGSVGAIGAAAIMAIGYQYAVHYIPFIYANALLTLALGAGVGLATGSVLKFGKCRNAALASGLGLAAGALALVVTHWVGYRQAVGEIQEVLASEGETVETVEQALPFGEYLRLKSETGWTIGSARPSTIKAGLEISGALVWVVWLIEAGAIIGVATFLARKPLDHPFCESCGLWTKSEAVGTLTPCSFSKLSTAVLRDDMAAIIEPERDATSDRTAHFTLHRCPSCGQATHLSCKVTYKTVERGKHKEKSEEAFKFVAVDEAQIATLRQSLAGAQRAPLPKMEPAKKAPLPSAANPAPGPTAKPPARAALPPRKPLPGKPKPPQ